MNEKPIRIQRKRTKGWKAPPNTVSVTRPGPFGNPFTIGCEAWRFSPGVPYPVPQTIGSVSRLPLLSGYVADDSAAQVGTIARQNPDVLLCARQTLSR